MTLSRLARCLNPDSFVVIGGRGAERSVLQSRKFGYAGEIYAVNAGRDELGGVPCFASVVDLPAVPDSAFVAVPAAATIDVVRQLSAMGCGGAVCYASGFLEVGSDDRHRALIEAAGAMPVIGPNCYGMINALNGAVLWPDWQGLSRVDRGVAIFTGSGNVSVNMTMQDRSLPIAMLVTIGNQITLGFEQLMDAAIDDERITAIGLHIEGIKNAPLFVEIAARAASVGKPVIALKTGRSDAGARIAMSHTATLAGSAELYDKLFERVGVGQVHDLESFLEALRLVSVIGPLSGGGISSMSCSGGEASLIADLCHDSKLHFPEINPSQVEALKKPLNEFVDISNPLDYHTFIWGDKERLRETFTAMLNNQFDLSLLLLDTPSQANGEEYEWLCAAEAFAEAAVETGRPAAVVASLAENMPQSLRDYLLARGVAPMLGLPQALSAISAAVDVTRVAQPLPELNPLPAGTDRYAVTEYQAKQMLADWGLVTTRSELVSTVTAAEAAATAIGYPVVLKASVEGLAHKTEANAVVLDVGGPERLREECERLLGLGGQVLVETMVEKGVAELLLGVIGDPIFGHYMVVGCGGTLVEILADRQVLILPAADDQVREALSKLRIAPLLHGYRGQPGADIDAIVGCIQNLSQFVADHRKQLLEVDINPLIVGSKGATVVDALVVLRGEPDSESRSA